MIVHILCNLRDLIVVSGAGYRSARQWQSPIRNPGFGIDARGLLCDTEFP